MMKVFSQSKKFEREHFQTSSLAIPRLVQLDKLRLDTRKEEVRLLAATGGLDPQIIIKKPSCNKGGVPEKFIMVSCLLLGSYS